MRFKVSLLFVLMFIFSVVIVGCSSTETSQNESNQNDGTSEADDAKGDGNENGDSEGEASGSEGGILRVALDAQPPTLDVVTTTALVTRDVTSQMFESLITFNSNHQPEPMLAESFETSEDGKKVTFKLREGVLFHNGKEMKAADVVASMNRWLNWSSRAKAAFEEAEFKEVDEYTVVLDLEKPNRTTLSVLSSSVQLGAVMPKEVIEAAGDDEVTELIGTGPFQFEEWKQDQYIKLTKFDDYQSRSEDSDGPAGKRQALVDELYFMIVTDASTRVAGVQSGEYDISTAIPFDNYEQLEADSNIQTYTAADGFDILVFNKKEGILTDVKMRQAIAAALDMDAILKASYSNEAFFKLNPSPLLEEQADWYTDAGGENYNQKDPEKAKQLLEEAGYNGETITFVTSREYLNQYNASVVIKEQLEQVGMTIDLQVFDWATVKEVRADPSAYNAFITGFSINTDPTQFIFWDSKNEWDGWTNNPEIDRLLDEIRAASSQEEAKAVYETLQEEHWTSVPAIKFGDKNTLVAMSNDVKGFQNINGMILWNVTKN